MTTRLYVGDVRDRIADIGDGSVDLVLTSPPFLALRKYGDNDAEMGSEDTPADFLDALLELTQEFRRVLAPHGSIAIELGDTYSGTHARSALDGESPDSGRENIGRTQDSDHLQHRSLTGAGWPLSKSLALIPQLYPASLAYGRNLLNPAHTFAPWRVRNVITWCRPNPPVGALGDKVRPATSYITVACMSARRWFDLDAVRTANTEPDRTFRKIKGGSRDDGYGRAADDIEQNPAGAPPLDWCDDTLDPDDPTDHMTIVMPTQPYPGAHYATWPAKLAQRLIAMLCPLLVCRECGHALESVNEEPSTTPDLRGVRLDDRHSIRPAVRTAPHPVLFGDLSEPDDSTESCLDPGMDTRSEGLHLASDAESPDGKPRGLRDGAPLCDGGNVGQDADGRSGGSSSQWDQGRQPSGEPRSDGQAGARPQAEASRMAYGTMPALRRPGPSPQSCPRCGSRDLRPGTVLDPFAGSGTTLAVAMGMGRDATGIELYPANADLIRHRVGMFLEEVAPHPIVDTRPL